MGAPLHPFAFFFYLYMGCAENMTVHRQKRRRAEMQRGGCLWSTLLADKPRVVKLWNALSDRLFLVGDADRFSASNHANAVLGVGAFGVVLHGTDKRANSSVALKFFVGPDSQNAFHTENLIGHGTRLVKNVVHVVHGFVVEEDISCIAMELCAYSLSESIHRERSPTTLVNQLHDILEAVRDVHALGVRHFDIKSENILLSPDGTARLCDFGLASMRDIAPSPLDGGHEYVQTPGYRAPEALLVANAMSTPADMWSMGCVLFEMFSRRMPFGYDTDGCRKQVANNMRTNFMPVRTKFESACRSLGVPDKDREHLEDLLLRMLCIDQEKRITAADALQHPLFSKIEKNNHVAATEQ